MHLHTTELFINHKSYHANYELDKIIRFKINILMNELTFLDLSKNANHSLTQSWNHNIRHLPEKKSTNLLLF